MATLIQMRRMVRNRLGVSSSDAFFRDDMLDDALNNAVVTFESERNWPWQLRFATLTATDDTGIIALPADWRATRDLRHNASEVLFVPAYELMGYAGGVGSPQVYSQVGNALHVRPRVAAGTVFELCYYRNASLLVEDADEPDLPVNAYPALVAKAAQLCSTREDDRPSAEAHLLEYSQWVQRLTVTGENTTRPVGRRIRAGNWV
jgi:hypothetical protein